MFLREKGFVFFAFLFYSSVSKARFKNAFSGFNTTNFWAIFFEKSLSKKSSEKELNKVNKKLSSIKRSNKDLLLNMKNIDYPEGNYIYIIKQKN